MGGVNIFKVHPPSTPGLFERINPFQRRKAESSPAVQQEQEQEQEEKDTQDEVVTKEPSSDIERSGSDSDDDEITYPEGGLKAWLVTFGSWCAMTAGFGTINTIGVFSAYISNNQLEGYDESTVSWIFGLYVFMTFFCGLQIGPIFDAKGPTVLLIVGAALLVLSIMLLGLCTQLWHFIIVFSLVGGVGTSLLFTPSIAAVSHWFAKRRGTATGLAATGGSFGGIIFPLMLQSLLPKVGWGWSTRILGFLVLFLAIAGILLCRSRLPPKKGDATSWRDMLPDFRIFNDGTGALAVTTAGIFFIEWGLFVPVTYIPSYFLARQNSTSDPFAYQLLAIFNAGSCFGRWLPGYVADRIGRYNAMVVTVLLCVLSVFGLWLPDCLVEGPTDSVALIVVFAVVFGFASGSGISLTPICVGELCETQEYGRYYATAYTIVSFSSLTGIPIAGALISATGMTGGQTYWAAIVFTGGCYAVALACFVWTAGGTKSGHFARATPTSVRHVVPDEAVLSRDQLSLPFPAHAVATLMAGIVFILHVAGTGAAEDASPNLKHRFEDATDSLDRLDSAEAAEAVATAQDLLSHIHTTSLRSPRHRKPTGFLATTWYFATEVFAFLFLNGPAIEPRTSATWERTQPWHQPIRLLEAAKGANNTDAMYLLGDISFHGKYGHPRNYTKAFDSYQTLASLTGNATAQHHIGFMYATGIGGVAEKDQARALVYHTFAADGGNTRSQMTAAYRHHAGIATPRNCDKAAGYYKKVAEKAITHVHAGPPGGAQLIKEAYRLADEKGGAYGEGASVTSSGRNAKRGGGMNEQNAAFDDVLEYLDLMSRKGELKATFGLGRLHYEGSRNLKQDYNMAKEFFLEIARKYWTKDGKIRSDPEPGLDKLASKAAGYLGRMFLRGEGMDQNFAKARVWFKRGVDNGDALCQYSLGLMYLNGFGVEKDAVRAADYLGAAADQDFSPAQVRLGALFLDQGEIETAYNYFSIALRHDHVEAYYYLAEIHNRVVGNRDRSCTTAALYYKIVAEKAESVHSNFTQANEAYEDGDVDTAMMYYMMAAEQGYEIGEANVAFLLDTPRQPLAALSGLLPWTQKHVSRLGDAALALIYWTRSAKQANIDSLVKMGDYYLSGMGTSFDAEKAAACYQAAAETHESAQAMWNLGWMHENGVGIAQDFHLAKRFYDQSLETNAEAYLPVTLALMKLRARSFWNTITRGKINSIHDDTKRRKFTFAEWVTNFLEADLEAYAEQLARDGEDGMGPQQDEWDTAAGGVHGDGPDVLYAEIDDGIVEMFAILGLAGALAFLVYYRQQAVNRVRRAREEEQQQPPPPRNQGHGQADENEEARRRREDEAQRGMFPGPGDPAQMDWVVGGIGH
ncbi:hypothetical protein FH972_025180 [Carpinus fangiana]|uniref:Major facilitator superfamily (MFS) profile domain-containing protein n=1 Tax=Carpinus fangiana TaxID=176857 RepID=A0A5N6L0U5_9ROSI|nr:hypothetical protein FH972_025180 [Carpinus fangiana]